MNLLVRLGQRMWEHTFFVLDDSKCTMNNIILGNDFGEKAGLVLDLTDHSLLQGHIFNDVSIGWRLHTASRWGRSASLLRCEKSTYRKMI